ncbi:hypothetical protein CDD81_6865 [Ophiocordyceps australis]|uniref:Zn(2)-C6 fungal-type domain-containing protein n=1 Tax=Ophiocordyceps australis TaxID=1399860 RepID=A0A2C5Y6Y1_9HYPO|nr:hypothetical protein CDD81_6865 [Ophiocordyceps australis]
MSNSSMPPPHKHVRVLACVLCQQRKIKCDRSFPCANCLKANVTCTPSTPAPARKRRRPNQDLQERLARCEELLKQYASNSVPLPAPGQVTTPTHMRAPSTPGFGDTRTESSPDTPMSADGQPRGKLACKVVDDGSGARFMDSYIWASVYEELQAMRNIVETQDPEESSVLGSDDLTPDNNSDFVLSGDLTTVNPHDLQPDPMHSFKLWNIFLTRVNPLSKVIHMPTVERYLVEGATNISSISLSAQALLFSIYHIAVFSLTDTECIQMFGMSRETALQRYVAGTKAALIRCNFLKNYNMCIMQALVLYLYSLQGRSDRHSAWIISGTAIRIAQKMGYHRDGETLNMTPFETEMRRRIWWQLVIQDSKYAMLSGLSQSILPLASDTKLPSNVNDSDLHPDSTEPIVAREGPTEMAFCLVIGEVYRTKMEAEKRNDSIALEAAMLGQSLEENEEQYFATWTRFRAEAENLERRIIDLEKRCVDANAGEVHRAALVIRPLMTCKISEMLVPIRQQPEWGTEIFGPKDNFFKILVLGSEHKVDAFDRLKNTSFAWFVRMHFQHDIFAVMTGQLSHRPTGSLADRAYISVERIYEQHPELFDMTQKHFFQQAQFTLKAWEARERAFVDSGRPLDIPSYILRLRELVPAHDGLRSATSSATPPTSQSLKQYDQPFNHLGNQQHNQQYQRPGGMSLQQQNGDIDPFLGGYLDLQPMNWPVFGGIPDPEADDDLSAAMFNGLGLGNLNGATAMETNVVDGLGNPSLF